MNNSSSVALMHIATGAVMICIELGILGGNLLVILAVVSTRRLQTVTNLYVLSLAISDLCVSVFVLPPAIIYHLAQQWPLAAVFCKLWISCDIYLCTSSIFNLCCISLDRYWAITQPLQYATRRRSRKLARLMILAVWLLALVIAVPGAIGWGSNTHTTASSSCQCQITLQPGYRLFSASLSFFLPFVTIIFVYSRIFWVAYQRNLLSSSSDHKYRHQQPRGIASSMSASATNLDTGIRQQQQNHILDTLLQPPCRMSPLQRELLHSSVLHTTLTLSFILITDHSSDSSRLLLPHNPHQQQQQPRRRVRCTPPQSAVTTDSSDKSKKEKAAFRKEHKTAKTLALVVGCFSICWMPFFCLYLAESFCSCTINLNLIAFVTWLGYVNSIFNPFIYAFYNKEYANAFKKIICILFPKRCT